MLVAVKHGRDCVANTNVLQAAGLITFVNQEDEEELLRTLGGRVKWARMQRQLSQAALGKAAGVSQSTIGNIEAGIRNKPRELLSIAAALEASPAWLEAGKGTWDARIQPSAAQATSPKGNHIHELTDDEWAMLTNYRRLLDKDRKGFDAQIAKAADERQQEMDEIFARYGVVGSAERANARKARDEAQVEITRRLQQEDLFDPNAKR